MEKTVVTKKEIKHKAYKMLKKSNKINKNSWRKKAFSRKLIKNFVRKMKFAK